MMSNRASLLKIFSIITYCANLVSLNDDKLKFVILSTPHRYSESTPVVNSSQEPINQSIIQSSLKPLNLTLSFDELALNWHLAYFSEKLMENLEIKNLSGDQHNVSNIRLKSLQKPEIVVMIESIS